MKIEILPNEIDFLTEIGNIGAGNAATALSQILSKQVSLSIPYVKFCNMKELNEFLDGNEIKKRYFLFNISKALRAYPTKILERTITQQAM